MPTACRLESPGIPWFVPSDRPRPPRLRPMAPGTIADNVQASEGVSDEELVARLYDALASLPPAERAAAVVAFGFSEGPGGVASELGIAEEDADALTRNALQLLRGALGDIDLTTRSTTGGCTAAAATARGTPTRPAEPSHTKAPDCCPGLPRT